MDDDDDDDDDNNNNKRGKMYKNLGIEESEGIQHQQMKERLK
jgi:hypothetical protein